MYDTKRNLLNFFILYSYICIYYLYSGKMMAVDGEPYMLVERPGFRDLLTVLAPRYVIPSRTYFSSKVVPELYDQVKIKVMLINC